MYDPFPLFDWCQNKNIKLFKFVKSIAVADKTNRVQILVSGRNQCNGMNEALEKSLDFVPLSFNDLEWDGCRFEYC